MNKINLSEEKIKKQKKDNYRLQLEKYIDLSIKKEDIDDNIKQKERILEFERMKKRI